MNAPNDKFDPYKSFKFRLLMNAKPVAGFSKTSALPAAPAKSPGRSKYDSITLERGITHDLDFAQWANTPSQPDAGSPASLKNFRKEITLAVYDEAGRQSVAYRLHRCWVSEFQALPDLDADANALAIQAVKLEAESWNRE
jgi:phage tail-like protein